MDPLINQFSTINDDSSEDDTHTHTHTQIF